MAQDCDRSQKVRVNMLITKKYIEEQYHLAMLDYKTAKNEVDQWEARKTMARLEQIAMQEYGFKYADELKDKEMERMNLS